MELTRFGGKVIILWLWDILLVHTYTVVQKSLRKNNLPKSNGRWPEGPCFPAVVVGCVRTKAPFFDLAEMHALYPRPCSYIHLPI